MKQKIEGIREMLSPLPIISSWMDKRWIKKRKTNTFIDTYIVHVSHGSMESPERSDSKRQLREGCIFIREHLICREMER